jgi:hypothetical protein
MLQFDTELAQTLTAQFEPAIKSDAAVQRSQHGEQNARND